MRPVKKGEVVSLPRILTDADGDTLCSECGGYLTISNVKVVSPHAEGCSALAKRVKPLPPEPER